MSHYDLVLKSGTVVDGTQFPGTSQTSASRMAASRRSDPLVTTPRPAKSTRKGESSPQA